MKHYFQYSRKFVILFTVKQNSKSDVGNLGEEIACRYLSDKNYEIIDRNYRRPWGELDVIARDSSGVLVFVEVKTMRANVYRETISGINPEDNLTSSKLRKLQRTAALYVGYNKDLVDDELGWRIDLVAITIPRDVSRETLSYSNLTNLIKYCDVKHFENI